MAKVMIMGEFLKLSDNIINKENLEKYIEFCLEKDVKNKIKGKTTSHHILPMAKTLPFNKFKNLSENPWNKSELYYFDHYYAHYLLTQAIDHYAVIYAFTCMHKRDIKLNRILENDLICDDEFSELWKNRNNKISEQRKEIINVDGELISRAEFYARKRILSKDTIIKLSEKISGDNNPSRNPETLKKIRQTKSNTFINGENLDKISADRAATKMKQEYINENGEKTSIYKENGIKISNKLLEIEDNGRTKAYNRNKKSHEKLREKGKWYKVLNVFDSFYEEILCAADVRKICANLESKTKENYLGINYNASKKLIKNNKKHLIGLYVEKIQ